MNATDSIGRYVDDAFLVSERQWLERVPPEEEWDASEAALVVEDVVGLSRLLAGH